MSKAAYSGEWVAGAVRDIAGNCGRFVLLGRRSTNKVTEPAAYVTGVEITSDPGTDGIYATGEAIEFTATFSNAVTVDEAGGTPRLRIDMGLRLEPDRRWAGYDRGTDSTGLVFAYTVAASDESHERGVGWLRNGLELDGGTIGKTGTDEDAVLDHPSESGERRPPRQLGAPDAGRRGDLAGRHAGHPDLRRGPLVRLATPRTGSASPWTASRLRWTGEPPSRAAR